MVHRHDVAEDRIKIGEAKPPLSYLTSLKPLTDAAIASTTARLFTHPLDTLKIQIQNTSTPAPLLKTCQELYREGGVKRFYQGLPISLFFSIPGLSVYLLLYDRVKDWILSHGHAPLLA